MCIRVMNSGSARYAAVGDIIIAAVKQAAALKKNLPWVQSFYIFCCTM